VGGKEMLTTEYKKKYKVKPKCNPLYYLLSILLHFLPKSGLIFLSIWGLECFYFLCELNQFMEEYKRKEEIFKRVWLSQGRHSTLLVYILFRVTPFILLYWMFPKCATFRVIFVHFCSMVHEKWHYCVKITIQIIT